MKKIMRLISVILPVLVLLCICVACGSAQIAAAGNTKPGGSANSSAVMITEYEKDDEPFALEGEGSIAQVPSENDEGNIAQESSEKEKGSNAQKSSEKGKGSSAKESSGKDKESLEETVKEDGEYSSKEEVACYIHLYGHLPSNYITKKEAQDLGWSGGYLWDYAPGKSIGGSRFGNYEGLLPEAKGRKYFECDVDYNGKKRGAKRIVYSSDGLIYYTEDHYETFEQLY